MLTANDIHSFLKNNGIRREDTVLVHTSMRALGEIEGGCDGLIDAFISYLDEGLFLVPTHTWANVGKDSPVYDVRTTEPCIGALPRVAAKRKDGVRSLHPTHSVTAFGKRAEEFVRGEERANTPCGRKGVWQRLYDEDAKILLIGVGLDRNTYIHAIDEMLCLPGRLATPNRLTVIDKNGKSYTTLFSGHGSTGSKFYENYRRPLEFSGALKNSMLGDAKVGIFHAKTGTRVIKSLWTRTDYNLVECEKEIPEEYYKEEKIHPAKGTEEKKLFKSGGSEYISEKIKEARSSGLDRATVSGCWEIEREIRIPSGFTLILENCHLRMADGVYSNMFVNEHHGTKIGKTPEGTDRFITIEGRGEAILDGGNYNGLSEKTQLKNGLPPIWKNNLILFTNIEGFRISGLSCKNQRWWALCFIYARCGYLGRIDFESSDIWIDDEGGEHHSLRQDKYSEILIKNSDGIDLRQGCRDILIEDITGFTEDDAIALTGINGAIEREFRVDGLSPDIANAEIRNVSSAAFCSIVRLLNQDGIKLHGITVDGIYDTSDTDRHLDYGAYGVRIGDRHLYGERYPTPDETHDIKISNVKACGLYAINLECEVKNLELNNIECFGKAKLIKESKKTNSKI